VDGADDGGGAVFIPAINVPRPPFDVWRAAALANAALLLTAEQAATAAVADRQLLYIARAVGTRVVSNGAELVRELRAHHPRVRHVVLERLPVAQQMMTVASSAGLIGAHGSGLVWTTFLPAGSRPTAVIEMLPRTNSIYWSYALIFPDLCAPLGVRHWTVRAEQIGRAHV
jgi:capsular polysaccharide biosynthesis protein